MVFKNDQFYGKTQYEDKLIKVGIDEDNIEGVQIKQKGNTILLNIGIPVFIVGVLALAVLAGGGLGWY